MMAEEIKDKEKAIQKDVQKEVLKAKESPVPPMDELFKHIFATNLEPQSGGMEYPAHIRMPNYEKSFWIDGQKE
jgi:TPP-dependent pyruvate/acetoin dehydrogenase alpha subunit